MQYPMADASSYVSSKCGKTLEHSHLGEKRQPLHPPEEAQRKECAASVQPMIECHQQKGEHKDFLLRTIRLVLELRHEQRQGFSMLRAELEIRLAPRDQQAQAAAPFPYLPALPAM
ncbi:hypothetical protein HPB50_018005 [Hyalomma asiaticum]|uniref:Uncharacterized protein n=1 Tax=Hyalomma asiaticum TaxID=266040 RepID=A0ACB7RJS6_HYAAI|nr:hypothetical protein HPB50_018005 [Hyalomma asiaticum]